MNELDHRQRLAAVFKAVRIDRALSQHQVAIRAGLAKCYVSQLENAYCSPRLVTFVRLCQVLKVAPDEMLRRIVNP